VRRALHAEWTKLRTVTSTTWLVLASIVLTVGVSTAVVAAVNYSSSGSIDDTTKLSLMGIDLGQAVVAVLAVMAITSEYGTGMIRVTLAAVPSRHTVLAAKAAIVTGLSLATGTIAVLGCVLAGRLILPANGFTPANGHALLSLADGSTLRAAAGSVLYLVLIALLSLGIATAVRDSAIAIAVVLGLLYLFPILTQVVTDEDWQRRLQRIAPMTAGLAIQDTTNLDSLPISPWAGLGVLAVWAAAALVGGGLVLRLRDA
jgi:ABC-2 type transport system permease protein